MVPERTGQLNKVNEVVQFKISVKKTASSETSAEMEE